jgi:hypothetical protein
VLPAATAHWLPRDPAPPPPDAISRSSSASSLRTNQAAKGISTTIDKFRSNFATLAADSASGAPACCE